jgi:hypothetical protein
MPRSTRYQFSLDSQRALYEETRAGHDGFLDGPDARPPRISVHREGPESTVRTLASGSVLEHDGKEVVVGWSRICCKFDEPEDFAGIVDVELFTSFSFTQPDDATRASAVDVAHHGDLASSFIVVQLVHRYPNCTFLA